MLHASTQIGGMLPTAWPVAASASAGEASRTRHPISRASALVSTLEPPAVSTSSGTPLLAQKTSDLTTRDTSVRPSAAAASAAEAAGSAGPRVQREQRRADEGVDKAQHQGGHGQRRK